MSAIQEEIVGFEALLDQVDRVIAEARSQGACFGDSDFQVLFRRISHFFTSLCTAMSRLRARARYSPNPVFAALYDEACASARMQLGGELLLRWGLDGSCQVTGHRWDVDFLELDYHLRVRRAEVLADLEAFRDVALLPMLARWQARRAEAPAALEVPSEPTTPWVRVAPPRPRPLLRHPALKLA